MPRQPSRTTRWRNAANEAVIALERLRDVQTEYEEWRDGLPENLAASTVGEKLDGVCDIDIDSALEIVNDAEDTDLPLGYGRD